MSVIVDVVNSVNSLAYDIKHFFTVGIFSFFKLWFPYALKWGMVGFYKFKNLMLGFLVTFLQDFLYSVAFGQDIEAAFASLDSRMLSMLNFFRVPEAINIIFSAYFSRLLFRMIGF